MRVLGVIPARLGSTRLPNKPLQLLAGEPLVTRVIQRVANFRLIDTLVVATDSPMVAEVAGRSGVRAVLTDAGHLSGTERVAEVAERPEFADYGVVVNLQGDEPFLSAAAVEGALGRIAGGDDVGTAAAPLEPGLATDPSRVKVVLDAVGRALYFSRAPIPFRRETDAPGHGLYLQHLGLYAYTRDALRRWVGCPPPPSELAEHLEQLRALHYGLRVGVARLDEPAAPGIDTLEDLRWAEAHWHASHG